VLIIGANAHVAITGQMLQQAILVVIPCPHIIRNGVLVITEKDLIQVVSIPGPQLLPVTGIDNVEIRRQVIPEILLALVVNGSRLTVPCDLPPRTPSLRSRDV